MAREIDPRDRDVPAESAATDLDRAYDDVVPGMATEHADALDAYLSCPEARADDEQYPDDSWQQQTARRGAPAVVRGAIDAICRAARDGIVPTFPRQVGQIYVWDPDAW